MKRINWSRVNPFRILKKSGKKQAKPREQNRIEARVTQEGFTLKPHIMGEETIWLIEIKGLFESQFLSLSTGPKFQAACESAGIKKGKSATFRNIYNAFKKSGHEKWAGPRKQFLEKRIEIARKVKDPVQRMTSERIALEEIFAQMIKEEKLKFKPQE